MGKSRTQKKVKPNTKKDKTQERAQTQEKEKPTYQLVLRINEDDAYFIVISPHKQRTLKENEVLVYEAVDGDKFREKIRDAIRELIRLEGEVKSLYNE